MADDFTFVRILDNPNLKATPLDKNLYSRLHTIIDKGNDQLVSDFLFGVWKVDDRKVKLEELLIEQYKLVDGMRNKQSCLSWKEFYDTYKHYYSKEEIVEGKIKLQQKGVKYD